MYKNPLCGLVIATAMLLSIAANATGPDQGSAAAGSTNPADKALGIDTLYRIPSPIGTEPGKPTWSSDAQQIAFLWNENGGTFRDVWLYNRATGKTRRLTDHGDRVDASLEHRGVAQLCWLGQQVAYTLDGELHISTASGAHRALNTGLAGIHQLRASPDGKQLSFVANSASSDGERGTAAGEALWLLDTLSKSADSESSDQVQPNLLLDPGHAESSVKSHQWSPNGKHISFALQHMGDMAERQIHYYRDGELQIDSVRRAFPGEPNMRFDLGVVDTRTGKTRMLVREDDRYPVWGYGLSADGLRVFVNESDPYVKLHRIQIHELRNGERQTFYEERDPRHLRPDWKAAWAPDDEGLIILTDRDGYLHLYHQKSATSSPVQLTSGDWEISDFAVADASRELYFRANKSQPAERQLYRVALEGGEITRVSGKEPGTHKLVYAPDMRSAASVFSSDQSPPELYLLDFDALKSQRLTVSPAKEYRQQRWADVRYIQFNSHVDGTALIGRLSLPPDFDPKRRYPLIVGSVYSDSVRNQWGGRTAHPTWGLDQHLVARGYILLNVNVRGSWGQGREHNQGLLHSYGNVDIDDLHSGVLHLVEKGYADAERVGIWGSSYGGLMTMMSLFKKPGVYAAGIAGAPATNVWHAYPEQMWVMGPAEGSDMPARYEKQSPLFHTDGLRDPLMIIHGNRDEVVLYADTIAVVNRLIAAEQSFELVTLPGAGHGWDAEMNDQRRFSFHKMVEFFDRYLQPSGK